MYPCKQQIKLARQQFYLCCFVILVTIIKEMIFISTILKYRFVIYK